MQYEHCSQYYYECEHFGDVSEFAVYKLISSQITFFFIFKLVYGIWTLPKANCYSIINCYQMLPVSGGRFYLWYYFCVIVVIMAVFCYSGQRTWLQPDRTLRDYDMVIKVSHQPAVLHFLVRWLPWTWLYRMTCWLHILLPVASRLVTKSKKETKTSDRKSIDSVTCVVRANLSTV